MVSNWICHTFGFGKFSKVSSERHCRCKLVPDRYWLDKGLRHSCLMYIELCRTTFWSTAKWVVSIFPLFFDVNLQLGLLKILTKPALTGYNWDCLHFSEMPFHLHSVSFDSQLNSSPKVILSFALMYELPVLILANIYKFIPLGRVLIWQNDGLDCTHQKGNFNMNENFAHIWPITKHSTFCFWFA